MRSFPMPRLAYATLPLLAALLSACGGGGGDEDAPPARGSIVTAQLAGQAAAAVLDAGTLKSGLQALTGKAACGVDVRYVLYITRDPQDQPATASAAVFVPNGTAAACTGNRPVMLYAHGTTTLKSYNIADIQNNSEGSLLAAMFAAQGYIVVAPNYLGYDKSSLSYHPYLNAENQAIDMVDGLRAAKTHLLADSSVKPSAQLFVAGYSEGGHVAMATHRAIERGDYGSEFTVTASAPLSGPHNLVKFITQTNNSPDTCAAAGSSDPNCAVTVGSNLFTPMLLTSWQKSYGGLYSSPADAYQTAYASTTEDLFPTDTPVATLVSSGKLPADATFRKLFGTGGLINDTYRKAYFAVADNGFKKAATLNTLLGWTPKAGMALCYSGADPTVPAYNSTDAQADFASRGVKVPALDLRGDIATIAGSLGTSAATLAGAFQQTYPATVSTGDHSNAAPFCAAFARGYFTAFIK